MEDSIWRELQESNDDVSYKESVVVEPSHPTNHSELGRALMENNSGIVPEHTREFPEGLDSAVIGTPAPAAREPESFEQQFHENFGAQDSRSDGAFGSSTDDKTTPSGLAGDFSAEHSMTRRLPDDSGSASITFRSEDRTQPMARVSSPSSSDVSTKISHGFSRPLTKSSASLAASVTEAQMLQAENLRMAQARILELEKEVEQLRQENELLASAGEIAKKRADELLEKAQGVERLKIDALDQAQVEMNVLRENLSEKDHQLAKMRQKIEDLETRLAKDLKKIRVRERELENRLELSKMEKTALVRAKDDAILDLRNKVDLLHSELESYKHKCADLNQKVDGQHEQLSRTVRALRLALTHLEANDTTGTVTPLKKAE